MSERRRPSSDDVSHPIVPHPDLVTPVLVAVTLVAATIVWPTSTHPSLGEGPLSSWPSSRVLPACALAAIASPSDVVVIREAVRVVGIESPEVVAILSSGCALATTSGDEGNNAHRSAGMATRSGDRAPCDGARDGATRAKDLSVGLQQPSDVVSGERCAEA